jgi:hypothetical protein
MSRLTPKGLVAALFFVLLLTGCASSAPASTPRLLSTTTPIIVRTLDASGVTVLPDRTVPIWQYVEGADRGEYMRRTDFEAAFEADLHAHDASFSRTHRLIDGGR